MYIKNVSYRYISPVVLLLVLCRSAAVLASSAIVEFSFEDQAGEFANAPTSIATGIDSSSWSDIHGALTDFGGNPSSGRALAARAFDQGNTLSIVLTVAPGYRAVIDGYSFDHLASSTGPQNWVFAIDDVSINSGTTSSGFANINSELAPIETGDEIKFSIIGADASSARGTYRLDNFVITGAVTPVPIAPAFLLLGSALAFMPRLTRR